MNHLNASKVHFYIVPQRQHDISGLGEHLNAFQIPFLAETWILGWFDRFMACLLEMGMDQLFMNYEPA